MYTCYKVINSENRINKSNAAKTWIIKSEDQNQKHLHYYNKVGLCDSEIYVMLYTSACQQLLVDSAFSL